MTRIPAEAEWIEPNRPCVICGGSESALRFVFRYSILPRPFEMRQCAGCGLLFNSPRLANLELLYQADYYVFSQSQAEAYGRTLAAARRHLDPARGVPQSPLDILEVGCARGHLLHVLRSLGHRPTGLEPSQAAAEEARRTLGVEVIAGFLEEYVRGSGARQHDVVWCNDVVEHVPDPLAFVHAAAAALKPGGRLVLDTPNASARDVLAGRKSWAGFCPYHIYLFDAATLSRLCAKAGLRTVAVFSYHNRWNPAGEFLRRIRRGLFSAAKTLGLPAAAARLRRAAFPAGPARPDLTVMTDREVAEALADIPWFSQSEDAAAPLAEGCHGVNLALHCVKPQGD